MKKEFHCQLMSTLHTDIKKGKYALLPNNQLAKFAQINVYTIFVKNNLAFQDEKLSYPISCYANCVDIIFNKLHCIFCWRFIGLAFNFLVG
ncbi:MAG: hypothetical protein WC951_11165 [Bacteroidales bacterium]|nr:hypothetical protein [Tenuifilaceae bacterium]